MTLFPIYATAHRNYPAVRILHSLCFLCDSSPLVVFAHLTAAYTFRFDYRTVFAVFCVCCFVLARIPCLKSNHCMSDLAVSCQGISPPLLFLDTCLGQSWTTAAACLVQDSAVVEYNDECVSLMSIAEGIKKWSRDGYLFFNSNEKLSGNVMQKSNKHQNKDKGKATLTSINADDRKLKTVKRRKRIHLNNCFNRILK